jgi:hypothetical protein
MTIIIESLSAIRLGANVVTVEKSPKYSIMGLPFVGLAAMTM